MSFFFHSVPILLCSFRTERQWRDLAFCLSMLSYNERGIRKLQENFGCFHDKLAEEDVYQSFLAIVGKSKKFAKPEVKVDLQSWTKVLGTVLQNSYFSVNLGPLLKQYIIFEIFLQFSLLLHPIQSWNSEKILDTRVQHCCGLREWVGSVWIGKRPRNAKVSQDFRLWLYFLLSWKYSFTC